MNDDEVFANKTWYSQHSEPTYELSSADGLGDICSIVPSSSMRSFPHVGKPSKCNVETTPSHEGSKPESEHILKPVAESPEQESRNMENGIDNSSDRLRVPDKIHPESKATNSFINGKEELDICFKNDSEVCSLHCHSAQIRGIDETEGECNQLVPESGLWPSQVSRNHITAITSGEYQRRDAYDNNSDNENPKHCSATTRASLSTTSGCRPENEISKSNMKAEEESLIDSSDTSIPNLQCIDDGTTSIAKNDCISTKPGNDSLSGVDIGNVDKSLENAFISSSDDARPQIQSQSDSVDERPTSAFSQLTTEDVEKIEASDFAPSEIENRCEVKGRLGDEYNKVESFESQAVPRVPSLRSSFSLSKMKHSETILYRLGKIEGQLENMHLNFDKYESNLKNLDSHRNSTDNLTETLNLKELANRLDQMESALSQLSSLDVHCSSTTVDERSQTSSLDEQICSNVGESRNHGNQNNFVVDMSAISSLTKRIEELESFMTPFLAQRRPKDSTAQTIGSWEASFHPAQALVNLETKMVSVLESISRLSCDFEHATTEITKRPTLEEILQRTGFHRLDGEDKESIGNNSDAEKLSKCEEIRGKVDLLNKSVESFEGKLTSFVTFEILHSTISDLQKGSTHLSSMEELSDSFSKLKSSIDDRFSQMAIKKIDRLEVEKILSNYECPGNAENTLFKQLHDLKSDFDLLRKSVLKTTGKASNSPEEIAEEPFVHVDLKLERLAGEIREGIMEVIAERMNAVAVLGDEVTRLSSELAEHPNQAQIDKMLEQLQKVFCQRIEISEGQTGDMLKDLLRNLKNELKGRLTKDEMIRQVRKLLANAKADIENDANNAGSLMVGRGAIRCLGCDQPFQFGVNPYLATKKNHSALPSSGGLRPYRSVSLRPIRGQPFVPLRRSRSLYGESSKRFVKKRPSVLYNSRHHRPAL